jgi:hypothetical protein
LRRALPGVALAAVLWAYTFLGQGLGGFWPRIALSVLALVAYATLIDPAGMRQLLADIRPRHLAYGALSGLGLYLLFLAGFALMRPLLVVGASAVYGLGQGTASEAIGLLLIFTSLGEEYFWRGFVQRRLASRLGAVGGLIVAAILYSGIHLPTLNPPLLLAALIAGLAWGGLYARTGSLWAPALSHLVWTELIFVLFPLKG